MSITWSDSLRFHRPALIVFTTLAFLFLWDVLLLDYSLGAFDIILNQPSWKSEFAFDGIHQPILSDSPTAHYPQRELDWGHAALLNNVEFNPYIFTGMPWSTQGVGAFVTSVPQLFLDIKGAIDWSTWLRLVCAGFFMYLLMLEAGVGRIAGVFAGVLWAYNLHQVVWLEYPQHLATQLWIPLVFLFNLRILRNGLEAAAVVALAVVNVLFFTSGYTQIVLYTYVTIGLFNSVYVLLHASRDGLAQGLGRWVMVHAVYIGAVAICAVGLYAEVKYISEGLRGAQEWRGQIAAPELSLGALWSSLSTLVPNFEEITHVLTPHYYGGIWDGRYGFEKGNIVESGRYFGVLGLVFAVAALFAAWHTRHMRLVWVFAIVMALVFSMINRNEFTLNALRLIPFADKGSYSRFITLLAFFGCVLAGYGLQCTMGRRYKLLLVPVVIAGGYVAGYWMQTGEFTFGKLWYPGLLIAGLFAAIAAARRLEIEWKWVACLVVAAAAADLFATGYDFNTRTENDQLFARNNTIRFLLNDPEPYRVAVISDKPLYHPNVLSYYDIPVLEGYLTVLPLGYADYVYKLFPNAYITQNGILFLFEPNVEAFRLLNVKYVLSDKPLEEDYEGLEHVIDSNHHAIYRVTDHLPRVYCASDVFYVHGEESPVSAYRKRLGGFSEPLVLEGDSPTESYGGECRIGGLQVYTHGLKADIESDEARWLTIPYAFNENWSIEINGTEAALREANGYHMAVSIPAGTSTIELSYRNPWSQVSAVILILAAAGVLWFAWRRADDQPVLRIGLTAVAAVVIFKSSLSLPLIRNDTVPERAPLTEKLEVVREGVRRTAREVLSERILKGSPLELPLHVESRGLTRIALLAGTFHQPRLTQTVTVEILDGAGDVLVEKRVEGERIHNNSWFTVDFPPIEQDTRLSVRVSAEEEARNKSFILWLDKEEKLCVLSHYRVEP